MKNSNLSNRSKIYYFIKKNILYVLIIVFILLITELVYCNENKQQYETYYYYSLDNEDMVWENEEVEFNYANFDESLNSFFYNYFNNHNLICMPVDTTFLETYYDNGNLFINISPEILNHGGSFYESVLLSQIFRTALSINGVNSVTILINNSFVYMPEGINTFFVTSYEDFSYLN